MFQKCALTLGNDCIQPIVKPYPYADNDHSHEEFGLLTRQ